MNYEQSKKWSDRFQPEIKAILGVHLLAELPDEDRHRNTDLIVFTCGTTRIACRVRRGTYAAAYTNEFTIRMERPSGAKSELTKIVESWGDWLFYGFADETENHIAQWFLGDLNVFRLWFTRYGYANAGKLPGTTHRNSDNSSSFLAIDRRHLPSEFIIAQGEGIACVSDSLKYNSLANSA